MKARNLALASVLAMLSSVGHGLAQPSAPDPTPAPTRVRPTVDLGGTHIVEMALYFAQPSEAFDTGITVTGFRADGCGFVVEPTARARRDGTTVISLGVHETTSCAPENRNQDTGFTAFLGALAAGHYEVTLGGLTLPFDVAARIAISDEWAVRLAVSQRYQEIGVHACGMPPYYREHPIFPDEVEAFKREHADVWAFALEIGRRNYPPAPAEEAARLIGIGRTLGMKVGVDGAWAFSFTSSACCSSTTTTGTATMKNGVVVLPDDAALQHQTVTRDGCKESDFPV